jgi:hypothetical protein
MARPFLAGVLCIAAAFLAATAAFNAWVDPFQSYRKSERFAPRFYPAWQRHENPGLAKHYDYDRVVTGSSLMENVLPADVDRVFGGRTINLSVSAQTAFDAGRLLRLALGTGRPRHVVMNLDYNAFSGATDRSGFEGHFPGYLYDTAVWNDWEYLLGIGTLRKSLETAMGLQWTRSSTNPDRMWYWADGREFSAAKAVEGLDPADLNARFRQPPRTLDGMKASFEANIAPVVADHPAVRFTFLFAPYSILVWSDFEQRGQLEVTLAFREWLLGRLQAFPQAELFDFQAEPAYVANLEHYTDLYHFSPELTRRVLADIAAGRQRLTAPRLAKNNEWLRHTASDTNPHEVIAAASRKRP